MKRILGIVALAVGLLFGTSAMPAGAINVGGTGCKKYESTESFTHAPGVPYTETIDSGYQQVNYGAPAGSRYIYVFRAAGTWLGPVWGDHNIEMPNGARYGFRWHSYTQSLSPLYYHDYWDGNTHYECWWFAYTFVDGNGTLVSSTYVYDSRP